MHAKKASFITLPHGFTGKNSFFHSFSPWLSSLFPASTSHLFPLLIVRNSYWTFQPLAGRHNKHKIYNSTIEISQKTTFFLTFSNYCLLNYVVHTVSEAS